MRKSAGAAKIAAVRSVFTGEFVLNVGKNSLRLLRMKIDTPSTFIASLRRNNLLSLDGRDVDVSERGLWRNVREV
jgi:hypothetical protein